MFFPPLEDLSRLNQALMQLMEHSADSMLTGIGALAPGRAAELTAQVAQLETAISEITHHLEAMRTRLETSATSDVQSELTADMAHVKTTMADVTRHLESLTARLETSDASVSQQVDALRDQMQTTHEATTQQLTALAQRLDETKAPPKRSGPRTTTRRKPQS
jgi:chromosome segregation ATPase